MSNSNLPDIFIGVNFPQDPFDATAASAWSDLGASNCLAMSNLQRGRQYELDQTQAGQGDSTWWNRDEYLNPTNTASPYVPNVVPYRPFIARVMYPTGGTGNLLNLTYNSTDPTFEAYTAGSSLSWVTGLGGTSPVVLTSTS